MWKGWLLVLLVGCASCIPHAVDRKAHRHAHKLEDKDDDFEEIRSAVSVQRRDHEEIVPLVVLGEIAGDIAINFVASVLYSAATSSKTNNCVRVSNTMNTFYGNGGVRLVDDDLLRVCPQKSLILVDGAADKKHWHVHSHNLFGFQCLFEFEWRFRTNPTAFDCRLTTLEKELGKAAVKELKRKYVHDSYFTWYVGGLDVTIEDTRLENHEGYVYVYPALPRVAFSTDANAIKQYHNNPFFYIHVEGWTYGDCTRSKGKGVKWVFSYRVDPLAGEITYITTLDSENHPQAREHSYLPIAVRNSPLPTGELVDTYQENTAAEASRFGLNPPKD